MNNTFNQIIDFLFLGNSKSPEERPFDLVVNCTKETEVSFPSSYNPRCIRIPIRDDPYESNKLLQYIQEMRVLETIHEHITQHKSVLVNCSMGMQRSCSLVACYLIQYHHMEPFAAIDYIKSKRPVAFFGNVNFATAIELFNVKRRSGL